MASQTSDTSTTASATPGTDGAAAEARIDTGRTVMRVSDKHNTLLKYLLPISALVGTISFWEFWVAYKQIPFYILPAPSVIWAELVANWASLAISLRTTLTITLSALATAIAGGVVLAILLSSNRIVEYTFFPYAVILQVTPIIAIAPILLIYFDSPTVVLVCAWIVAFFPILSNTTLGLNSTDHNLTDLFQLYGASRMQSLLFLRLPSALPYFLGGVRIAGGLSLIGAVVAEFTAAAAGREAGLSWRLIESYNRLLIPRAFAVLFLITLTGILIYLILSLFQYLLLRKWHESAIKRER